ncbi:hypothetical protein M0804_006825 [Polistes exclamans]|nr:hypothetical protein M0804_006825 [Polistes exclamans]
MKGAGVCRLCGDFAPLISSLNIHEVDEWCEDLVHTNRGLNGHPSPLDTGASNVFRSVKYSPLRPLSSKTGVGSGSGSGSSGNVGSVGGY